MNARRIRIVGFAICVLGGCGTSGGDSKPVPVQAASDRDVQAKAATGAASTPDTLAADSAPSKSASADEAGRVEVTGTKVSIIKPAGFVKAPRFPGFHHERWDSITIMVTEMPAPFKETSGGFTEERLKTQGMTLVSKESITLDQLPAMLLHVKQQHRGFDFQKWIVVFGNDKQTVVATGTLPDLPGDPHSFSTVLRKAVLSARWQPEQGDTGDAGLRFELTPPDSLKRAGRAGNMLMYTKDGKTLTPSRTDPLFVAGYALGDIAIGDKKQFAERRLPQTEQIKDAKVETSEAVKIAGLDAWEIVATAKDRKTDAPVLVYQVLLFDEGTYFIMIGVVGVEQREQVLPDFKLMAKSFRKK